eukprot:CAMPEP_0116552460 /NCGR_PEP_ID=MMETSP0397-20121206/6504_1 /TAXON_ID=216820 /ORGANISM="Cyclophora tenuis, Strain ECT3854" /LENGTH=374 /DNA_ID=CAMNT_0004077423 /DNA_START=1 /DNA_END=1125 /DNA_ORIENTATION=-
MYRTLQELDHLKLFGAISARAPPASGSHIVTPMLLEEISGVSMKALTPKPTNRLLIAGVVLSAVEAVVSLKFNVDFNLLVFSTLLAALADQALVNGAFFDTFTKLFYPGVNDKILRHEAGHFLCAYLLGCPVEGYVLSPWAAREDARFNQAQVSAGTSFFDPILSDQINTSVVTRSTLDRYSIIVMGGIAAEALLYGQADGGAGDEAALVGFLSRLNGPTTTTTGQTLAMPPWNEISIRNQARWGALQAVLMLKEYKPCYDALVDALERGGSLGDCIFAIEKAGRDNGLSTLQKPLGYILDQGMYGEWTTKDPPPGSILSQVGAEMEKEQNAKTAEVEPPALSKEEALVVLSESRKTAENRLKEIEEELKRLGS